MEKSNIHEKIKLLTGNGMWHTQENGGLALRSDRPTAPTAFASGVKKERQNNVSLVSTCYPTASALPVRGIDRAERLGRAVAKEAWNADVAVLLGPGINMKRSPCAAKF